MPTLQSTNLAATTYDEAMKTLTIDFQSGAQYLYYEVPDYIYDELTTTIDPGAYFKQAIEGKFAYERVA